MRAFLTWLLWPLLAVLLLALVGGFGGGLFALGDSLAAFRLPFAAAAIAVAVTLMALSRPRRRYAALAVALVTALAAPAATSYRPKPSAAPSGALTIYQKNLNHRTAELEAIAADILAVGADIVALQEVSARNQALLERLRAAYPTQTYCPFASVGGTAVLSRLPATSAAPVCAEGRGLSALQVEAPGAPVWAVSLHLRWPWPGGQAYQVERLVPFIEALEGPVMVAGDFNMVPWGATVTSIADAARAVRVGATVTTFDLKGGLVPLAIDHVLLPEGWAGSLEVRPDLGSDHRGLVARTRAP